jgi:hypothetical protein
MSIKTWIGKLRIVSGARRPDSGCEVEVRITRTDGPELFVELNTGTDARGDVRWMPLAPSTLDPVSLCAALVDAGGA